MMVVLPPLLLRDLAIKDIKEVVVVEAALLPLPLRVLLQEVQGVVQTWRVLLLLL